MHLSKFLRPESLRGNAHFPNLFFGSSLRALCLLAERKGHVFVGSNANGNDAYFVKRGADLLRSFARISGLPLVGNTATRSA